MTVASTAVPVRVPQERARPRSGRRTVALAGVYYLLAALAVTLWLWRDPASRTVAGNPNDADQFAWFFRYDATAIAHFRLPDLVTTAMNAPQGVNLMWNTPLLLPGVLLAPVTLLFGPQVSLTVLLTAGFAGSATAMFAVLRRWQVSVPAAAFGAAVYGFSPALVHSAIGHYDLQFGVFPPLIADAAVRLAIGRASALRGGLILGLLVAVQLFISEEIAFDAALAAAALVIVVAASRPRLVAPRIAALAGGAAIAAATVAALAGYPLWVQFFGPLPQHGSPFATDFFKNDLSGFVVPSSLMLFHTAGSAAQALRYQGRLPEYVGYLGWPLIAVLTAGALRFWRRLPVRACAVTCAVLLTFSLGGTLLASGHQHAAVKLPWYWLQGLPVLSVALPDRFSVVADGAAAALLAFCADAARPVLASFAARRLPRLASGPRPAVIVMSCAVLAVLPIVPRPLPAVAATPPPAGWSATFAALRLPASAAVLVVPVPMSTFTEPLRWQADTGQPATLVGGYFMGPAAGGRAATDGSGLPRAGRYLNALWAQSGGAQSGGAQSGGAQSGGAQSGGAPAGGAPAGGAPAGGAQSGGAQSGGAQSGGAQSGGAQSGGAQSGGAQSGGAQSGGAQSGGAQSGGAPAGASAASRDYAQTEAVSDARMRAQIAAWKVSAVVAVTTRSSVLARYLTALLGPPSEVTGNILAWRT